MFKKLLFGTILLSSLAFGSDVLASEISDIDDLQVKIETISKEREGLANERIEKLEDKKKEDLLQQNVKTIGVLDSLKPIENKLDVGLDKKEETTEEKITKINTKISVKDSEIETLEKQVTSLKSYEEFLKESLKGIEYKASEMTKTELEQKLSDIESRILKINEYKIEVSDNSLKDTQLSKLKEVKDLITNDIKNFKTDGQKVVEQAMKYLGVSYVWGGKSPDGMDCSGLTQLAYRHALGKEIGVWTVAQESSGTTVSVSEAEVGDLLFWGGHGSTHHVAIYIGEGRFIHAPQPGDVVKITNLTDFMPDFALKVS